MTNAIAPTPIHRLVRSENKKLAGVCGGLADYFGIDATIVRVLYVVLTLATGIVPGIVLYLAMAAIMPRPYTAT